MNYKGIAERLIVALSPKGMNPRSVDLDRAGQLVRQMRHEAEERLELADKLSAAIEHQRKKRSEDGQAEDAA